MNSRSENAGRRDVEKRWSDAATTKHVVVHVAVVIALAFAVLAAAGATRNVALAAAVPGTLFLGGVVALARGYAAYRHGANWVHWQAGAWTLLAFSLVALSVPAAAA